MAKNTKTTKKKVVRIDALGKAFVYASFNNVIVSLTNNDGQVISWSSAGKMGFRGSKKNTPYAAQMAAQDCAKVAYDLGLRRVKVYVKGPGIASRYGGEEFTVLLRRGKKSVAMKVAERIRKKIEGYDFVYNDQHLHVTISAGVAVFDKETNPVELPNVFVNQADTGLYMSKNNGRNQVTYFDPTVHKLKEFDD